MLVAYRHAHIYMYIHIYVYTQAANKKNKQGIQVFHSSLGNIFKVILRNVWIWNFFTFYISCRALFYGQWQGLNSPAAARALLKSKKIIDLSSLHFLLTST